MSMRSSYQATQDGSSARPVESLESWKEIANYLGRTVRTAQRWCQYEGLPVRYHYHRKAKTVYAFKNDIDSWRVSRRPLKYCQAVNRIEHRNEKYAESTATLRSFVRQFLSVSVPGIQIDCPALLISISQPGPNDRYDRPREDSPPCLER